MKKKKKKDVEDLKRKIVALHAIGDEDVTQRSECVDLNVW